MNRQEHCLRTHMYTPPTVQSSAPLSCVSPPGVAGRLFLAICVKLKNIAIRTVRSADVKTRSSADRAQLYLRTALKGEYLGQGGGGFCLELSACVMYDGMFFSLHPQQAVPSWHQSAEWNPPVQTDSSVISKFCTSSLVEIDIYS